MRRMEGSVYGIGLIMCSGVLQDCHDFFIMILFCRSQCCCPIFPSVVSTGTFGKKQFHAGCITLVRCHVEGFVEPIDLIKQSRENCQQQAADAKKTESLPALLGSLGKKSNTVARADQQTQGTKSKQNKSAKVHNTGLWRIWPDPSEHMRDDDVIMRIRNDEIIAEISVWVLSRMKS